MKCLVSLLLFTACLTFGSGATTRGVKEIAYLSDVEGNWEKFNNFFENNENFFRGSDGKFHLKPNAHFVFGGDVPDRGPGSLRITQELLRLKNESGDNVTFIIGNRDGNKVRLPSELSDEAMKFEPNDPSWREWLSKQVKDRGPITPEKLQAANTKINRLKWILQQTMGASSAFEFRRQELGNISGRSPSDVTDQNVLVSFIDELKPNGDFSKFLEAGKLARRIGNTLFLHSGLSEHSLGYIPGKEDSFKSVDTWIDELNTWYLDQIKKWKEAPQTWSPTKQSLAQELIDYTKPLPGKKDNPRSIVYGRNNDAFNNPLLPSKHVIEQLGVNGIKRLVIGHTPTGQFPFILTDNSGFELISGDNSYAPNESSPHQINLKGNNLDTVSIKFSPKGISGIDHPIQFSRNITEKSPIGSRLSDGSTVVASYSGNYITAKLGAGRTQEYKVRSANEVRSLGYANPVAQYPLSLVCAAQLSEIGSTKKKMK